MATFQKRQKEMKRLEKQREKAERRAQKKLANRTQSEPLAEAIGSGEDEVSIATTDTPTELVPRN